MRIFSKLVFICNICFLIAVCMRFLEMRNKVKGGGDHVIPVPALETGLILLGYGAIFINSIFVIICLFRMLGKKTVLSGWITVLNILIFFLQIYYFFIYR